MRVILLENILSLGQRGEIREVSDGYAMNYLLAQKKALVASPGNLVRLQSAVVSPQARATAHQKIYKILQNQTLNFSRKVSDKGHLFQAVGPQDIVSAVAEKYHINIKSKWLHRPPHFKSLGEYQININIPDQPALTLSVKIKAE